MRTLLSAAAIKYLNASRDAGSDPSDGARRTVASSTREALHVAMALGGSIWRMTSTRTLQSRSSPIYPRLLSTSRLLTTTLDTGFLLVRLLEIIHVDESTRTFPARASQPRFRAGSLGSLAWVEAGLRRGFVRMTGYEQKKYSASDHVGVDSSEAPSAGAPALRVIAPSGRPCGFHAG